MRVAAVAAAAILSAAALACGGTEDEPQAGRLAAAITYGEVDTGDPAVVAIADDDPCSPTPALKCSGTLIAPRVVLTAAHCVGPVELMRVFFGSELAGPGQWIRAADADAHPDFDSSTFDSDIGVIILETQAPIEPVALASAPLTDELVGGIARLVGFGVPEPGGGQAGVKRQGTSMVTGLEPGRFLTAPSPSMSCQLDSGGPVYLTIGDVELLAGVTSSGDPFCEQYAGNTRVDQYLANYVQPLIDAAPQVGPAPPPPDIECLAADDCTMLGCGGDEQCNVASGMCEPAVSAADNGGCSVSRAARSRCASPVHGPFWWLLLASGLAVRTARLSRRRRTLVA